MQEHPCPYHLVERDDLFGPLPGHGCKTRRIASGFVISDGGFALTNHHVVENAILIEASFGGPNRVPIEIVGSDPETDVALLRITGAAPSPPPLPIGHSDRIRIGDIVFALGTPVGLSGSMTRGIVSYTNRFLSENPLVPFVQTDVGLHPGNSGGPLLDGEGRVIGMNTALLHSEGLGFAVPIDLALRIAERLKTAGHVDRGSLGIFHQPLEPGLAKALGVSAEYGLLITDVLDEGPAKAAGLEPGEVIISLNEARIDPEISYEAEIAALLPGSVAVLGVERPSGKRQVSVTVTQRAPPPPRPWVSATSPLSMTLGDVTDGSPGAEILEVEPGGAAERAGLAQRDRVIEAAGRPVSNLAEFREAAAPWLDGSHDLLLRVRRGPRHLFAILVQ